MVFQQKVLMITLHIDSPAGRLVVVVVVAVVVVVVDVQSGFGAKIQN